MKRFVLPLMAMLLSAAAAAAQDPDAPPPNPELERQELVNLEMENARALKTHSSNFFKNVYSEDFRGVTRYGEVLNKTALVSEVQEMTQEFDSIVVSDFQVRMYRDAACVLSLRSEVSKQNGKKFYSQYRVLRMYVNTSRGWRVVSQLETRLQ